VPYYTPSGVVFQEANTASTKLCAPYRTGSVQGKPVSSAACWIARCASASLRWAVLSAMAATREG